MALDGGIITSVLAGVFAIVSSGMGIWAADRRAARKEAGEIRAAAAAERQHKAELEAAERARVAVSNAEQAADLESRSSDLMQYIDTKVAEATKDLRDELGQVKRLVGSIYGRLSRTREAFRSYIWQVRSQWNKSDTPPPVERHVLELLGDDDLDDTFTAAQIAEITNPDHIGGQQ